MARGGYRRPSGGPRAGGPGKASQREDANEVPTPSATAPRVGENSGLAYGDRQKFEESRKIAPIASSGAPSAPPPSSRRGAGATGNPARGILQRIANSESRRPSEDITTGMDTGPGAGSDSLLAPPPQEDPDPRQAVLQFLASRGNRVAELQLMEARQPAQDMPTMMPGGGGLEQPEPESTVEPLSFEAPRPSVDADSDEPVGSPPDSGDDLGGETGDVRDTELEPTDEAL